MLPIIYIIWQGFFFKFSEHFLVSNRKNCEAARVGSFFEGVRRDLARLKRSQPPQRARSGEISMAHEIAIALASGAAPLVKSPNNEALPAPAIAGGENALDVGRILFELGFNIRAGVAFDAKRFE
jgi:hypothetical protein